MVARPKSGEDGEDAKGSETCEHAPLRFSGLGMTTVSKKGRVSLPHQIFEGHTRRPGMVLVPYRIELEKGSGVYVSFVIPHKLISSQSEHIFLMTDNRTCTRDIPYTVDEMGRVSLQHDFRASLRLFPMSIACFYGLGECFLMAAEKHNPMVQQRMSELTASAQEVLRNVKGQNDPMSASHGLSLPEKLTAEVTLRVTEAVQKALEEGRTNEDGLLVVAVVVPLPGKANN